ncbi:MAG: hypothetical protein HC851_14065 [Acaryochloris sp. RU_4_1]|nr:hypothetical protein [Acaryochloris sp. RU_4_1]NJR55517.1 hypothetical protein [Acaryochloris sp. CRU_2_0]
MLLCDGGGSNSSRYYIFKQDLQTLVNEFNYPPQTSKYNPIEHRLFPHVSRVCQGVIFESVLNGTKTHGNGNDAHGSSGVYDHSQSTLSNGSKGC